MKLAHKLFGDGPALIILHGLFGSSDNWQTLGRRFAEDFSVYLPDQRNHGHSPHSDEFDYDVMADDLQEFMDEYNIRTATLIGHSMGGKTAMRMAQKYPDRVEKLVVADMGVRSYDPHHDDVLEAFHALRPETLESRKEAEDRIENILPDFGVRQFLLKNLYRKKEGGYGVRVNFSVIEDNMDAVLEAIPKKEVRIPALFIRGSKSNYIRPEDMDGIRRIFPEAEFTEIDAGHWLHADDPDAFYEKVMEFETKSSSEA